MRVIKNHFCIIFIQYYIPTAPLLRLTGERRGYKYFESTLTLFTQTAMLSSNYIQMYMI